MMNEVYRVLTGLRVPLLQGEYDLHRMAAQCLEENGLPCAHEVKLAPRCRIDLMTGGIGIECKKGKPDRAKLVQQLSRYAACEQVEALIVVVEKHVDLPPMLHGKPVKILCLNRLWGIAL